MSTPIYDEGRQWLIDLHRHRAKVIRDERGHKMPALVTETHWIAEPDRVWFGFRFDPTNVVKVGDVFDERGFRSIVREVVDA